MYKGKSIGAIISDQLTLIEMSTVELKVRLKLSRSQFESLMDGNLTITPEIAVGLSTIFNTPVEFWYIFNYEEEILELHA